MASRCDCHLCPACKVDLFCSPYFKFTHRPNIRTFKNKSSEHHYRIDGRYGDAVLPFSGNLIFIYCLYEFQSSARPCNDCDG